MDFKPNLLMVNPDNEFRWRGGFIHPSIFQGEHYFMLEGIGDQQTRLVHGEKFTGLLSPIFNWIGFERNTRLGFEQFNVALKARVEA